MDGMAREFRDNRAATVLIVHTHGALEGDASSCGVLVGRSEAVLGEDAATDHFAGGSLPRGWWVGQTTAADWNEEDRHSHGRATRRAGLQASRATRRDMWKVARDIP